MSGYISNMSTPVEKGNGATGKLTRFFLSYSVFVFVSSLFFFVFGAERQIELTLPPAFQRT